MNILVCLVQIEHMLLKVSSHAVLHMQLRAWGPPGPVASVVQAPQLQCKAAAQVDKVGSLAVQVLHEVERQQLVQL